MTTLPPICSSLRLSHQPDQKQQYQCSDHCRDDVAQEAATSRNTDLSEKPRAEKGSQNTDHDVAQQSETVAAADDPGQPARNCANQNGVNQWIHKIEN